MSYEYQSKQPTSWDELGSMMEFLSDCGPREVRLEEDVEFYNLYRELVPKKIVLEIIKKQIGPNPIALVRNNFPYSRILEFLPNVKHYCLWSTEGSLSDQEIKNNVNSTFPHNDWHKMERKINYKSVPEIWHCHIFVKFNSEK